MEGGGEGRVEGGVEGLGNCWYIPRQGKGHRMTARVVTASIQSQRLTLGREKRVGAFVVVAEIEYVISPRDGACETVHSKSRLSTPL